MRFRSRGKPRGVLAAKDQRRLTLVIAAVGAIVVMISLAGRPEFWTRILGRPPQSSQSGPVADLSEDLLGSDRLQPDEFMTGTVPEREQDRRLPLRDLLDRDEAARLERLSQGELRPLRQPGPEPIPAKLLRPVRDDVIGVHSTETESWFASLRMAEKQLSLNAAPKPQLGQYALFMDSPEACRGEAWEIHGTLRRLTRVQSDANSFGVKSLYDAWISMPDSGNQLIHVVAAAADPGLPLGDTRLDDAPQIRLAGYFFKREGYVREGAAGEGDVGLAPLLVSGRIHKAPPSDRIGGSSDRLTPILGWIALVVCCGVVGVIWQFQRSDTGFRRTRTHQLTVLPVRVSFDGVDAVTVRDTLRKMEDQSSADDDADASL